MTSILGSTGFVIMNGRVMSLRTLLLALNVVVLSQPCSVKESDFIELLKIEGKKVNPRPPSLVHYCDLHCEYTTP